MTLGISNFTQGGRDTAIYQTALWQAGNFFNPVYFIGPGHGDSVFFSLHFMPIGFIYGLFYKVFPSLYTTAIIYVIVYIGTFVFTYLSTKIITNNKLLAFGFAIIFLTCYSRPIHDFYPIDDWAMFFVAGGLYFYLIKSFKVSTILWIIVSMHKEYYSLSVAAFGIAILLSKLFFKNKINVNSEEENENFWASIWIVGGIFWFLISFFGIMIAPDGSWENKSVFSNIGGIEGVAQDPLGASSYFFQKLLNPATQNFLFKLFIPFLFLSIIGIEYTFSITPIIIILLLIDGNHTAISHGHYTNWFFPFLINGGALGYKRIRNRFNNNFASKIIILISITCISYQILDGLRYYRYWLKSKMAEHHAMTYYRNDVKMALEKVPSNSKVATDEYLLPYFANRRFIIDLSKIDKFNPDYIVRDANQDGEKRINSSIYSSIYNDPFWNTIKRDPNFYYNSLDVKYSEIENKIYGNYYLLHRFGSIAVYQLN